MSDLACYHPEGLPIGVYTVTYYYLDQGAVRRRESCDMDVSVAYVDRLILEPDEIARAECQSQPGGAILFGSSAAVAAWRRYEKEIG